MRRVALAILVIVLAGCGTLIPKKVELFQSKVKAFPETPPALRELERQTIYQSHEKATETVLAAEETGASTNVIKPARETMKLTGAAVVAAGPPDKIPSLDSTRLANKLETTVADYNRKVDKFADRNEQFEGKKIEGTGLFQVPYLLWVGGIVVGALVLYLLLKAALTAYSMVNPIASIGLGAMNVSQKMAVKGFAQVIKGGENFKTWVTKEIGDSGLQQKILDAFQATHMKAQDQDIQNTIKSIT